MKNSIRFVGFCGILGIYGTIALIGAMVAIIENKVMGKNK